MIVFGVTATRNQLCPSRSIREAPSSRFSAGDEAGEPCEDDAAHDTAGQPPAEADTERVGWQLGLFPTAFGVHAGFRLVAVTGGHAVYRIRRVARDQAHEVGARAFDARTALRSDRHGLGLPRYAPEIFQCEIGQRVDGQRHRSFPLAVGLHDTPKSGHRHANAWPAAIFCARFTQVRFKGRGQKP